MVFKYQILRIPQNRTIIDMKIKNLKCTAIVGSFVLAASTSHAALSLGLTIDSANSEVTSYGGTTPASTLTDPFAYNPDSPTSPLPNQGTDDGVTFGFHADKPSGIHILSYTLTDGAFTTSASTGTIYFDFYGRVASTDRDDNYTVTLYNGDYLTSIASLTGQGVLDAAPYFNRSTFNLASGVVFDRIQLTSPASVGNPGQYFTVMEVRAATDGVPEPASILLGGLGALGLLRRRRLA
jgi:PEP-CTERM motif